MSSPTYSISPSLINAYNYIFKAHDGYEQQAYNDFLNALKRVRTAPNEAMLKGIEFENVVNHVVEIGGRPPCEKDGVTQQHLDIGKIVWEGVKQVKLTKRVTIEGVNLLVVGYADYIKEGVIYDIKTTKTYDYGKYLDNSQHPFYLWMDETAHKFEYLVCDFKDVHREHYDRSCVESVERELAEFIRFLKSNNELWGLFKKHRIESE